MLLVMVKDGRWLDFVLCVMHEKEDDLKIHTKTHLVSDADCCAVETGFESREDMDVCKCIVPLRHESTLNSRRAANPPVRLVEGNCDEDLSSLDKEGDEKTTWLIEPTSLHHSP
ncbi:hypothetical protein TNCV_3938721 [Trichonephila clavipes]|nr:hypothetical protein TNCV_3938721 [Trichonephila clavipes]